MSYESVITILKTINLLNYSNSTFYIFGGWVRDYINGVIPNDVDLFIKSPELAKKFISFLDLYGCILERYSTKEDYFNEHMVIKFKNLPKFNLDITTTFKKRNICDFTCNNLKFDVNENIDVRLGAPDNFEKKTGENWLIKCIKDVTNKELFWMIDPSLIPEDDLKKTKFYTRLYSRRRKMLEKGYIEIESVNSFDYHEVEKYFNEVDEFKRSKIKTNTYNLGDKISPLDLVLKSIDIIYIKRQKNSFYVYGGWVRDTISKKEPQDMDLFIKNRKIIDIFVSILKNLGFLKEKRIDEGSYSTKKCKLYLINNTKIKLDIVSQRNNNNLPNDYQMCDFTCNNLAIGYANGKNFMFARKTIFGFNKTESFYKCLNHIVTKKLIWMVQQELIPNIEEYNKYIDFHLKMKMRLTKMLSKGFSMGEQIYQFQQITFFDEKNINPDKLQKSCPICTCDYQEDDPAQFRVVLECEHYFHYHCLSNWLKKNRNCPCCRGPAIFKIAN